MRYPFSLLAFISFQFLSALWSDEVAANEIRSVVHQLEEKAATIKIDNVQGYATLMAAAKDLKKYIEDGDVDGSRLLVKLETSANMRKLFKAPAMVDKKTGQVAIQYDFMGNPQCVQDFIVGSATPSITKGGLLIPVAQSIQHKATFIGNVMISGKINTLNREGRHLSTTQGLLIESGSYNAWFINMLGNGYSKTQGQYSKDYTNTTDGNWLPFVFEITPTSLSIHWGEGTTGGANPSPFLGSLCLHGGTGGDIYKDIVISGTLDQNWIKQQLGIGATP